MKNDNLEILARIEAQLASLERKVDSLMHSSHQPVERERDRGPREFGGKGKMSYKAVCAECGQTCGVPFKPVGGRPVFCSECFAKHQGDSSSDSRFNKKEPRDFRKPTPGKKPYFKKR